MIFAPACGQVACGPSRDMLHDPWETALAQIYGLDYFRQRACWENISPLLCGSC